MKQLLTFIVLYLLFLINSQAQSTLHIRKFSLHASQVYIEGLGSGLLYSINYDQRFGKREDGFGIRIGASRYRGMNGEKRSTLPVQINYLLGNRGKYFEAGLGSTYGGGRYIDNSGTGDFVGTATIGYRRQPFEKKGVTWRLALTPLFVFEQDGIFVLPWMGASIGYRF